LNKSDEDKYTFENQNNVNIKNLNVEDNFDLDEFINEENNRIQKRITDLSTTNVSFFNINKDEVLNLDYNNFVVNDKNKGQSEKNLLGSEDNKIIDEVFFH